MRHSICQAVQFSAALIEHALAHRPQARNEEGGFSAEQEAAVLLGELHNYEPDHAAFSGEGVVAEMRLDLDEHLILQTDDPLARLESVLELSQIERDLLRLLLAWHVEPRIATLVGHLNDSLQDVQLRRRVLAELLLDPEGICVALEESAPLRLSCVVMCDHSGPDATITLDPRVGYFLVTGELPPLDVGDCIAAAFDLANASDIGEVIDAAGVDVVALEGPPGSGRRSAAAALALREDRSLWMADVTETPSRLFLNAVVRDTRLMRARLLYWGELTPLATRIFSAAEDVPLTLAGPEEIRIPTTLLGRPSINVRLRVPNVDQRAHLWTTLIDNSEAGDLLGRRFALTPGQIERAAQQFSTRTVEEACRMQLHHELDRLAVPVSKTADWSRLVLPEDAMEALHALCAQVRNRHVVDGEWGFGEHHLNGFGVKALFHGKPGTGKSFAARVVANDLGLDLYCVDVSKILSRWIGVAEERVTELFAQARRSDAILCFEEADSLFAARTPVATTATEKYSNTLVNQLLRLVEDYSGVVLLTTNLKSGLDAALLRRMQFVVEFPEPGPTEREALWRVSMPDQAPIDPRVDWHALACRHEICGGAIRNVVASAAYLAADEQRAIEPAHLDRALRWEYAKLDRLVPNAMV